MTLVIVVIPVQVGVCVAWCSAARVRVVVSWKVVVVGRIVVRACSLIRGDMSSVLASIALDIIGMRLSKAQKNKGRGCKYSFFHMSLLFCVSLFDW